MHFMCIMFTLLYHLCFYVITFFALFFLLSTAFYHGQPQVY